MNWHTGHIIIFILLTYILCCVVSFSILSLRCLFERSNMFFRWTFSLLLRRAWMQRSTWSDMFVKFGTRAQPTVALWSWATRFGLLSSIFVQSVSPYRSTTFTMKKKGGGGDDCFLQSFAWVNERLLSHWFTQIKVKQWPINITE